MAIFCIGDIHGKFDRLKLTLQDLPDTANIICVGDIGLGFDDTKSPDILDQIDETAREKNQTVWFIRGNHDDPNIWNFDRYSWNDHLTNIRIPPDIHRIMIENIHVIMVGGGTSLDRCHPSRIDGKNWWAEEAVSESAVSAVQRMINAYGKADLLVTHVGPLEANPPMARDEETLAYYSRKDLELRTDVENERRLISEIVTISQPNQSVFGHYHTAKKTTIGRTKYRCCAELEVWQYVKKTFLPPLPTSS